MSTDAPPAPSAQASAYPLLAILIVVWGANWPVMKFALDGGYITPFWFGAFRLLAGAACMFAFAAATGRLRLPPRGDMPLVLSVAFLQMATFMSLVNLGLTFVSAGRSAILAYTTPLWVTPLAILILGERLGPRKALGLAVGLTGVGVLFNPLALDWGDSDALTGNGILMVSAFCWAFVILHVRGHKWISGPLTLVPWQMVIAGSVVTPLAFAVEGVPDWKWSPELGAILLYNGPLATAFAFWCSVTVNRRLPAITVSLSFLGVPTAGYFFSALALSEPVTASLVGGLLLIVTGMALVTLADLRER